MAHTPKHHDLALPTTRELSMPTQDITDPQEGRAFIAEYAKHILVFYVASIQPNGEVANRPISIMFEHDDQIVFSTTDSKDLYEDLMANPSCSIAFYRRHMGWMRIDGKAVLAADQAGADALAQQINPMHYAIYLTDEQEHNAHFALTEATCTYYNNRGEIKIAL